MPFIISRVNIPFSDEQETALKTGLGQAISLVPGKSEASLMLGFEGSYHLYLNGDNSQPLAYITVAVFSNHGHRGYEQLSAAISQLFHRVLDIDPRRIFINYEDIAAWSVAGRTFSDGRAGAE
jgi:phenylpyruvate tautomerase PptA (4-oxalocrotonate tautomerase family)